MPAALLLIAQILPLIPSVVAGVTEAIDAFTSGTKLLGQIAAEGRDPTTAEWTDWQAKLDSAHQAVQAG